MDYLTQRPRRLRATPELRKLTRETRISTNSLIYPIFIKKHVTGLAEIPAMPNQFYYTPDTVSEKVAELNDNGVYSILLFGVVAQKDAQGSAAWQEDGVVQQAIRAIKANCSDTVIMTDVCLCGYTSHGHCGILQSNGYVDNDATLPLLSKIAVSHAQAGADVIAPSDMMDGRIRHMRLSLEQAGYPQISIMSYTAKYASAFYGPFRQAAGSSPKQGDRKSYQMDYHNQRESILETRLDLAEGADILMVKPALSYLDVIACVASQSTQPVAAYSVSGEYSMIKAASAAGYADEYALMCETATSIYRAGADILISYYAPELALAIRKGDIG